MKLLVFDIETYLHYFCIVAESYDENGLMQKRYVFDASVNVSPELITDFDNAIQEHDYIISYNGTRFDLPVLAKLYKELNSAMSSYPIKYIYHDAKALISYDRFNNPVIKRHHSIPHWNKKHFDMLNNCLLTKSLKQWAMYNNLPIVTLPYAVDAVLTDSQRQEILRYCINDVQVLATLFFKYGFTKGFVGSPVLKAQVELFNMLPENMQLRLDKPPAAMSAAYIYQSNQPVAPKTLYPNSLFDIHEFSVPIDVKIAITMAMSEKHDKKLLQYQGIQYGTGGAHFIKEGLYYDIYAYDVASLYPSIITKYKLLKTDAAQDRFTRLQIERLAIKKAKNPALEYKNQAYKLILNSLSGAFRIHSGYNIAYDNAAGQAMCAIGQLIITELALAIGLDNIIEINTDSVFVKASAKAIADNAVSTICDKHNIAIECEHMPIIYIRDVNNYIVYNADKTVQYGKGLAYSDYVKKNSERTVYNNLFANLLNTKLNIQWSDKLEDYIVKYHKSAASKYAYIDNEVMKYKDYYFIWTKTGSDITFSRDLIDRHNGSIKARRGRYAFNLTDLFNNITLDDIDYTQYHCDLDDQLELWNRLDLCTTRLTKEQRKNHPLNKTRKF